MAHILEALELELQEHNYQTKMLADNLMIWQGELLFTIFIHGDLIVISEVGTDYPIDAAIVWQTTLSLLTADILQEIIALITSAVSPLKLKELH